MLNSHLPQVFFPTNLFSTLEEVDKIINTAFSNKQVFSNFPPTDIYQKDDKYYMDIIVAGFNKEDIKIEVEDNIISVSAMKETKNDDDKKYYHKSISYRKIDRSLRFGEKIQEVVPNLNNGVLNLEIILEKPETRKKLIEIND